MALGTRRNGRRKCVANPVPASASSWRTRRDEAVPRCRTDRAGVQAAGRIRWDDVYERLGRTFTAREMQELTGATPNLVGSIVFWWKEQGRIAGTGERGVYRKTT